MDIQILSFSIRYFCQFLQLIISILSFREYLKHKDLHLLTFGILWAISSAIGTLMVIAEVSKIIWLAFALSILSTFQAYFISILADLMSKDNFDSRKLIIITFFGSAAFFTAYYNQKETSIGNFEDSLEFIAALAAIMIIAELIWLIFFIRLHINSPKSLKKYSSRCVFGAVLMGTAIFLNVMGLLTIGAIVYQIGALFIAYCILKEPRLVAVLPFRAYRLIVIHTKSGNALFSHSWENEEEVVDSFLFSGMLHGISSLLKESLKKGNIRHIHLDRADIILSLGNAQPIACILVASKTSIKLYNALEKFRVLFENRFGEKIDSTDDIAKFKEAIRFIDDSFYFVPNLT
jgi:hypothetical protein